MELNLRWMRERFFPMYVTDSRLHFCLLARNPLEGIVRDWRLLQEQYNTSQPKEE
jgi:hypothetical protein